MGTANVAVVKESKHSCKHLTAAVKAKRQSSSKVWDKGIALTLFFLHTDAKLAAAKAVAVAAANAVTTKAISAGTLAD